MAMQEVNQADGEVLRKYQNGVCKVTDLLYISGFVKKSAEDVYRCLSLKDDAVEKIERESSHQFEKIFGAFAAWYGQQERRTWGDLVNQLCKDDDLLLLLQHYLKKYSPAIEG